LFFKPKKRVKAVHKVDLAIHKGECFGLVGESGSGKSTLAKLIMRMESATSGQIFLNGRSIHEKSFHDLELYKQVQLVLQDSSSSLHPKMKVREILEEPRHNYFSEEKTERENSSRELLELVGLDSSFLTRCPDQLSGGQKQRVCIAKALAVEPECIIFDESIASLDQSSQDSILGLLKYIQQNRQLTYLFITHDLKSTQSFCDRVAVMYHGEIVETFQYPISQELIHPYSRLLFRSLDG
jgi:ABC-type dipeptide/oligopeptide/nickel transport system ATPase subunit